MRILVCADWHAGARTWGVDRLEETISALSQMYEAARDFKVDALFVLGDIFHSFRYPGEEVVMPIANFFSSVLSLPWKPTVYLLKGNHDWSGIKIWELFQSDGRFVFVDEVTYANIGDFLIFLLPYLRKHDCPKEEELDEFLKSCWKGAPKANMRLCFAHMAVEDTVPNLSELTLSKDVLKDLEIDLTICGHIHRHGRVSEETPPIYYAGSPLRLDFSEEGHCTGLYIIDEKGNIEDIPINSKELITLRYDDEEEAFKSLSTSSQLIPRDAYLRVIVNRSSLPISQLLDKCRNLGGEQIVVVAVNEGMISEISSPQDPFDIIRLWKHYIESQEENESTLLILKKIGEKLLSGKDPSTMWNEIKSYFEAGERY